MRVVIESPYAGDVEANVAYAWECLRDSLRRGEAPIASHLLYTQVLDDSVPDSRALGIAAGLTWLPAADLMVVYTDRGHSPGMKAAVRAAADCGIRVEFRRLGVDELPANASEGEI
jgi:hypothetical protein